MVLGLSLVVWAVVSRLRRSGQSPAAEYSVACGGVVSRLRRSIQSPAAQWSD